LEDPTAQPDRSHSGPLPRAGRRPGGPAGTMVGMTSPAGGPPSKPSRGSLTVRDMAVALGVLIAIVLVIGGLSRGFGFAPTGPTVDPAGIPAVDAPAELRALAPAVPFALRIPAVPTGWRSNSVARDPVAGTDRTGVRVGYLTAGSNYLQLLQSDATEEALLAAQSGTRQLAAQGMSDVGGQRWVVYGTRPAEPVWIADAGQVRLVISGTGTDDEYRALAAATLAG
jgi:hypothetical protein